MVGRTENRLDFIRKNALKTNIPLSRTLKICIYPSVPIRTLNELQASTYERVCIRT